VLEKLTEILREYKGDDTLSITPETTFESLSLDSIDSAELAINIEEEFGVTIETDFNFETVGDLLNAIKK